MTPRCAFTLAFVTATFFAGCGGRMPPYGTAYDSAVNSHSLGTWSSCASTTPPPMSMRSSTRRTPASHLKKTPIAGLLDVGQSGSGGFLNSPPPNTLYYACQAYPEIDGLVINDAWSDLQPKGEGTTIDTRNIDAALAAVRAYNAFASNPIRVRLRVWPGINAPQWAKRIGGPIDICDQWGGVSPSPSPPPSAAATPTPCPQQPPLSDVRTIGAFWTPRYQRAWANVQRQLAAKYDADPLIAETGITSCASITDEPFIHPADAWSLERMSARGFNVRGYKSCLKSALLGYRDWHQTILGFAFSPFYYSPPGKPEVIEIGFTESIMRDCVAALRSRCLLANEDLGKFGTSPSPSSPPNVTATFAMWHYMEKLHEKGALVTFQTATPPHLYTAANDNNLAGWNIAVRLAREFGAGSLEIWPPEGPDGVSSLGPDGPSAPCVAPPGRLWVKGYTCFRDSQLRRWRKLVTGRN